MVSYLLKKSLSSKSTLSELPPSCIMSNLFELNYAYALFGKEEKKQSSNQARPPPRTLLCNENASWRECETGATNVPFPQ